MVAIMRSMVLLCACMAAMWSGGVLAAYPDRPIRIVVPYAAGAAGDVALRQIQPLLEKRLGQPLVIDYRSGASGNIGMQEVVRARADGYTLVLGATNNFVINQYLFKALGFDPLVDLVPVGKLVDVPAVVWVNGASPAKSLKEFARYAKSHSGELNYGSPGNGTTPHLSGFMMSEAIQARMTHVPYRGAPPAIQALVANEVQLCLAGYSVGAPFLHTGKLKPLAVAAKARLAAIPDVPTIDEAGLPGVVLSNWWVLAAPKGTDPNIIDLLAKQLGGVLDSQAAQQRYAALGFIPGVPARPDLPTQLRNEARQWKGIVEKAGVTLDNY